MGGRGRPWGADEGRTYSGRQNPKRLLWGKTAREPGLGDTLPYAPPRCPGGPASRLALPRPSLGTLPPTGLCKNHRSQGQVLLPPGGHTVPTVTRTWGLPSGCPLEGASALACNFSPLGLVLTPWPLCPGSTEGHSQGSGTLHPVRKGSPQAHGSARGWHLTQNTHPHTGGQCHHARVSWPHFPHRRSRRIWLSPVATCCVPASALRATPPSTLRSQPCTASLLSA